MNDMISRNRVLAYIADMQLGVSPGDYYSGEELKIHEYAYMVLEWIYNAVENMPSVEMRSEEDE